MRLHSIALRCTSLAAVLLLSLVLTACGGSGGSSPSNSSSNNPSSSQPPKQETSTDDDKDSGSTENWFFSKDNGAPTVISTQNGFVVRQVYSVTNLSDKNVELKGVIPYNVASATLSQENNDYERLFVHSSLISSTITARCSSGAAPCIAVFDSTVTSTVIYPNATVLVHVNTLVPKGGSSITHFYNGTAIGNVSYTEVNTTPSGKIGDTLVLMGEYQLTDPIYIPFDSKFTCAVSITCTSKRSLCVSPTNFVVTVIHSNGVSSLYSTSQSVNNQLNIDPTKKDLLQGDSFKTTLTISNITISDGDTVKVQYWPRMQASEGLLGYTDAYATWTMNYHNGSFQ